MCRRWSRGVSISRGGIGRRVQGSGFRVQGGDTLPTGGGGGLSHGWNVQPGATWARSLTPGRATSSTARHSAQVAGLRGSQGGFRPSRIRTRPCVGPEAFRERLDCRLPIADCQMAGRSGSGNRGVWEPLRIGSWALLQSVDDFAVAKKLPGCNEHPDAANPEPPPQASAQAEPAH
jgi:hypothetical protein